jgi:CRP-like cAMP-binding protein
MLLLYKERMGREIEPGNSYEIDLSANQADLASLAAVSRELVNRSLQEWQARNLIEYKAGKITILDLAGVESEWQQLSGAMAGSGGW